MAIAQRKATPISSHIMWEWTPAIFETKLCLRFTFKVGPHCLSLRRIWLEEAHCVQSTHGATSSGESLTNQGRCVQRKKHAIKVTNKALTWTGINPDELFGSFDDAGNSAEGTLPSSRAPQAKSHSWLTGGGMEHAQNGQQPNLVNMPMKGSFSNKTEVHIYSFPPLGKKRRHYMSGYTSSGSDSSSTSARGTYYSTCRGAYDSSDRDDSSDIDSSNDGYDTSDSDDVSTEDDSDDWHMCMCAWIDNSAFCNYCMWHTYIDTWN